MKILRLIAAVTLMSSGLQAQGILPPILPQEEAEETGTTRTMDPEKWNGQVGEDLMIPEFGHIIETDEGKIQFLVWQNRLRLYFLDEADLVVDPTVSLVTARLTVRGRSNEFVRLSNKGQYLESNQIVRPPHNFFTILTILKDDEEDTPVYSFQFHQSPYGF